MRIVGFHAENFKRLGLVEIAPNGNVVTIGGKNGHGKSSVLDAIYVALKGRAVAPPVPIRAGEEKCVIRLDLGELTVTRSFIVKEGKPYTDTLKVSDDEGRQYGQPQKVLDSLLGEIGFDPFEFMGLSAKAQAARLLQMVPLSVDLDEMQEQDSEDFAARRDANRDVVRLKALVDAIPVETLPETMPDRAALADRLANAGNINSEIQREAMRRENERERIAGGRVSVDEQRKRAEALRAEALALDEKAATLAAKVDAAQAALEALPALEPLVDTTEIRTALSEAEALAEMAARQNERQRHADALAKAQAKADALTAAMEARAKERNNALAEAEMPVPGLAFSINEKGEAVLTYEGLPFDKEQISSAMQLRVSTAIGMSANPRLRVLRIKDGSLLDEDSMAMLADMANEHDFQVWVEIVGTGSGVGIIMENGEIRRDDPAPDDEAQAAPPVEDAPKAKRSRAKAKPEDGDTLL